MTNGVRYCTACGRETGASSRFCSWCGAEVAGAAAAPTPGVPLPVAAPQTQYAGFWLRFVAAILDSIAVNIVVFPVSLILGLVIGIAGGAADMPQTGVQVVAGVGGFVLGLGAAWLYEAGFTSSSRQATPGKMVLSIRVTDLAGQRITFGRATGRHFAKYISAMILLVGYIMAGFTEKKQALHDMIAGTLVVRQQT